MSVETVAASDPVDLRHWASETKHFYIRPAPIDRYLTRLRLPFLAYQVFWYHWDIGKRNGNFLSEVPISEVAKELGCDDSSVTRAYQRLKAEGLIRRQDPGRDPENPYRQATAITEVLLPPAALKLLRGAPNRRLRHPSLPVAEQGNCTTSAEATPGTSGAATCLNSNTLVQDPEAASWSRPPGAMQIACRALSKMSIAEKTRYIAFREGKATALEWDPDTALSIEERHITSMTLRQARLSQSRPPSEPRPTLTRKPPAPRKLDTLRIAALRHKLTQLLELKHVPDRLQEITWAVERGALAKHDLPLAVNIALKKVREGQWTRPYRMPPHFQLRVLS